MQIDVERLRSFSAEPLIALEEQMENTVRHERVERRQAIEERKARKRKRQKRKRARQGSS